jgi:hypothetical protein
MSSSQNAIANLNARAREHLKLKTKYEVLMEKNEESEKQFQKMKKKVLSLMDAFGDWQLKQGKIVSLEKEIGILEAKKKESEKAKQEYKTKESEYEAKKDEAKRKRMNLDPDFEKFLEDRIAELKKKARGHLDIEKELAVKQDHFKTAIQDRDRAQRKMMDLQNEIRTWTVNAINTCKKDRGEFEMLALKEHDEYQKMDVKLRGEDIDRRAKAKDLHDKLREARDDKGESRVCRSGDRVRWYPARSKIVKAACDDMEALVKRI